MDRANLSRVGLIFTDLRFDGFDSEVELGVIDELIAATLPVAVATFLAYQRALHA